MTDTKETRPPQEHDGHQWHWLRAPHGQGLCVANWQDGKWMVVGVGLEIDPVDLAADGWSYVAPAIPPALPE